MREYPKIETLFDRITETFKVLPERLRCPEFALVSRWLVTEKIDGTNIRVHLSGGTVRYGGRHEAAQLHGPLVSWLTAHLSAAQVAGAFDDGTDVTLFGEGYGAGIQKGGGYRKDSAFRLFDVLVDGWWLNWDSVEDIALKLGVQTVPVLGRNLSLDDAVKLVVRPSAVAEQDGGAGCSQEGVVARTDPLLLMRDGVRRVTWKLKGKDF